MDISSVLESSFTPRKLRFSGRYFLALTKKLLFLEAPSIEFDALYGKRYHRALVYGGMGTNFSGLSQAKAYLDSVQRMQASHVSSNPFEVNLASHPHLATLFERRDRALKNGLRAAYVDAGGVNHFLTLLKARGEEKLRKELQYRSEITELMP